MGKKNPFVFTIGFDKSDPDHVYVTELLNTTEKKAKLIVAAILAYTGRTDETGNGSISMEPDMLRADGFQNFVMGSPEGVRVIHGSGFGRWEQIRIARVLFVLGN